MLLSIPNLVPAAISDKGQFSRSYCVKHGSLRFCLRFIVLFVDPLEECCVLLGSWFLPRIDRSSCPRSKPRSSNNILTNLAFVVQQRETVTFGGGGGLFFYRWQKTLLKTWLNRACGACDKPGGNGIMLKHTKIDSNRSDKGNLLNSIRQTARCRAGPEGGSRGSGTPPPFTFLFLGKGIDVD